MEPNQQKLRSLLRSKVYLCFCLGIVGENTSDKSYPPIKKTGIVSTFIRRGHRERVQVFIYYGLVAPTVERGTENPCVAGSTPALPTNEGVCKLGEAD